MKESYPLHASWPSQRFNRVPEVETAVRLATEARVNLPVRSHLSTLGIEVRNVSLKFTGNALMTVNLNRDDSHFLIIYDPNKPLNRPDLAALGIDEGNKEDFVLGHELGHTFFYDWQPDDFSTKPKSILYNPNKFLKRSEPLEQFCDAFSLAIINQR